MPIKSLARNVPPRITDNDPQRGTDDGRMFPGNSINTKQLAKGFCQSIPVLFAMQFKYIAYWIIIFMMILQLVLQLVADFKIDVYGSLIFYFVNLVIVFLFIYFREYDSEKKRAMMDQKQNSIPCTKIVIDENVPLASGVIWKEIKLTTD